jgi:hypothetical protein
MLGPYLMAGLHGEVGGCLGVSADFKCKLSCGFLPSGTEYVRRAYGAITQPEPDCAYGYATRSWSAAAPSSPVFTSQQETKMLAAGLNISSLQRFPFLTAQWKRPSGSEGIHSAQTQGAGDGAAIVNLLHKLHGPNATLADTCHFSLAIDGEQVQFFVHWRADLADGTAEHHMKWLDTFFMRKEAHMRDARNIIKNIAACAAGPRLDAIKTAIDNYKIPPKQQAPADVSSDASLASVPVESPAGAPALFFPSTPQNCNTKSSQLVPCCKYAGEK